MSLFVNKYFTHCRFEGCKIETRHILCSDHYPIFFIKKYEEKDFCILSDKMMILFHYLITKIEKMKLMNMYLKVWFLNRDSFLQSTNVHWHDLDIIIKNKFFEFIVNMTCNLKLFILCFNKFFRNYIKHFQEENENYSLYDLYFEKIIKLESIKYTYNVKTKIGFNKKPYIYLLKKINKDHHKRKLSNKDVKLMICKGIQEERHKLEDKIILTSYFHYLPDDLMEIILLDSYKF